VNTAEVANGGPGYSPSDQRETLEQLKDESIGFPEMHSDFMRRRLVDASGSADTTEYR
jgi:hypothetical protein